MLLKLLIFETFPSREDIQRVFFLTIAPVVVDTLPEGSCRVLSIFPLVSNCSTNPYLCIFSIAEVRLLGKEAKNSLILGYL